MCFLRKLLKSTPLILFVSFCAVPINADEKEDVADRQAARAGQFRILSLDGGGVRGIIPATILDDIEKTTGQKITELFDMIGGTSTGGFIALYLNIPDKPGPRAKQKFSAADIIQKYKTLSGIVFQNSIFRAIRTVGGLVSSKYSAKPLEELLKSNENFGQLNLSQSVKPVLVTAIDINATEQNKVILSSLDAKADAKNYNIPMWVAGRATSAAPTFFKPIDVKIKGQTVTLVDGGVGENNPAFTILAHAIENELTANKQVVIVSIGTGITNKINRMKHRGLAGGGAAQALNPLIEALFVAQETSSSECARLAIGQDNFYRLAPVIDHKNIAMDQPNNIIPLQEQATSFMNTYPYARMLCKVLGYKCAEMTKMEKDADKQ